MSSQPGKATDLHGSAPDTCKVALLIIDLVNDYHFPGGDELFENTRHIYPCVAQLRDRAKQAGVPVIYINDNFGRWRSGFTQHLQKCLRPEVASSPLVQQIHPNEDDYFVLKPKHSAFFQTPLDLLLKHLGAIRLILTGISTNSCVLFTANDAYMRDLELFVPQDCVGCNSQEEQAYALGHMQHILKADTRPGAGLNFADLVR